MPDIAASVVRAGPLCLRHLSLDDTAPIFRHSQEQGMRDWLPDQVYADAAQALEARE